jgi:NADPH:quinone reductase-like Zn-dependent oxidoreductase
MRAFAVRTFGQSPGICDLPIPGAEGSVLVRVSYAGVNPVDVQLADQLTSNSAFPFVLGVDVAGVVERVPAQATDLRVGDRVFGMARTHGSYAEYTAVPPGARTEPLARIPDGVADEQAAVLPVAAIAALGSLELLGIAAGQRVVVMGAAGGVGGYAVQMALARGARVIATVQGSTEEARRLGAQEVYDAEASDIAGALRESHPDGVDAVLDIVNGRSAIKRDVEFLKPGGKLVSTVFGADVEWFAERQITAYNVVGHATPFGGTPNPKQSPQGLAEVAHMLAAGTITARIGSTAGLDAVPGVLEELRNGDLRGKAVIRLHGPASHPA